MTFPLVVGKLYTSPYGSGDTVFPIRLWQIKLIDCQHRVIWAEVPPCSIFMYVGINEHNSDAILFNGQTWYLSYDCLKDAAKRFKRLEAAE